MSSDNPAGLISTASIQSQDRSFLFYSRPNGTLAFLKSQTETEASPSSATTPLYKANNIIVDGNVISANTSSPQIAAVSYHSPQGAEIRVYYISDAGDLQELCQTNGGPWTVGSLNNSETRASPKSLLTASVNYSAGGQLKVYYNRESNNMMYCTWVNLNEESWATKKINDKY